MITMTMTSSIMVKPAWREDAIRCMVNLFKNVLLAGPIGLS